MENVIGTCFVLESNQFGVEPTIFLNRPYQNERFEKLHMFFNPFEARNFIRDSLVESIEVEIKKNRDRNFKIVNGGF